MQSSPDCAPGSSWDAICLFAIEDGYAEEYVGAMVQFDLVAENTETITLAGPAHLVAQDAPGIGWWLEHQLPIWTGKLALLVVSNGDQVMKFVRLAPQTTMLSNGRG